jgi:hypothetical protein
MRILRSGRYQFRGIDGSRSITTISTEMRNLQPQAFNLAFKRRILPLEDLLVAKQVRYVGLGALMIRLQKLVIRLKALAIFLDEAQVIT